VDGINIGTSAALMNVGDLQVTVLGGAGPMQWASSAS